MADVSEEAARKRPGRPRKVGSGRILTAVRFTPDRHRELRAAADAMRRSLSEEVESRIEELAAYKVALDNLKRIEALARQSVESAARQTGWLETTDTRYGGKIFIPPGQVSGWPQSGFFDRAEEQRSTVAMTASAKETVDRMLREAREEEREAADRRQAAAVAEAVAQALERAGIGKDESQQHHSKRVA